MFELIMTNDIKDYLKKIKKVLKVKGYKTTKSTTNRYLGGKNGVHINYITEYFIKGKIMFEIEIDKINNKVNARLHYENENKEIMLSSILNEC